MIKYCPYCTESLGFIHIVRQRLFAKEGAALTCDKCGSSISMSGRAKLGILIGGGGACGYLWGQLLAEFLPSDWLTIASSILVALIVIPLLAYWSAPIKSG